MQRSLREERGTGQGNLLGVLLSYGFRPFFLGAALWAILALTIWLGALAGRWELALGYGRGTCGRATSDWLEASNLRKGPYSMALLADREVSNV